MKDDAIKMQLSDMNEWMGKLNDAAAVIRPRTTQSPAKWII